MRQIIAAVLLATVASFAASVELTVGLYTTHFGPNTETLNEENRLVGLSVNEWEFGTYNNSYMVRSYYLARRVDVGRFGVMVGAVSGYNAGCVYTGSGCRADDVLPMFATFWRPIDRVAVVQMANAIMLTLRVPL